VRHNFIDRYAALDSPLHILESRTKLVVFTALIVAVLCIPAGSGSLFFFYFFATAILMGISQIPLGYIVGRTLVILPFIVLASLAVPWRGYAGLWILFVRAILCLMLLILLTNTTRFVELLRGLRKLGCPQRRSDANEAGPRLPAGRAVRLQTGNEGSQLHAGNSPDPFV
jgi:cobalt/nickel transport system permease protein